MAEKSSEDLQKQVEKQQFRVVQRERQRYHRRLKKDDITNQNRENLSEIENRFKYISEKEMEDMTLKFKKTKDSLSLQKIGIAACFGNKHIEAFFRVDGALTTMVSVMCAKDAEKQLEAAICLTNLACGPHKTTQRIAKATGAYLVSYMKGESRYLQDQCAWTAGNIASDCNLCFDILNAQGVLPALGELLKSPHPEVVQSAAFALNMCTQYESSDMRNMMEMGLVNSLMSLVEKKDTACQTLAYVWSTLSNITTLCINCFSDDELLKVAGTVFDHLHQEVSGGIIDVMLVTPAVRILGGLSTGSNEVCRFIINHNSLESSILAIMNSSYHHLKKELLWVLTNLLISCYQENTNIDWQWVIEATRPFLSPLDTFALQVLYFYCTIATLKPEFVQFFKNNGILQQAEKLRDSGKEEIDLAAKTFLATCCN